METTGSGCDEDCKPLEAPILRGAGVIFKCVLARLFVDETRLE